MGELAALITALTGLGAALAGLGKWLKDEFIKANNEQQKLIQIRFDEIEKNQAFGHNQLNQVQQVMVKLCEQEETRDREMMRQITGIRGRLATIEARVTQLENQGKRE